MAALRPPGEERDQAAGGAAVLAGLRANATFGRSPRPAVSMTCGRYSKRSLPWVWPETATLVIEIKTAVGTCGLVPQEATIGANGTTEVTGTTTGTSLNPRWPSHLSLPEVSPMGSTAVHGRAPLIEPAPSSFASCSRTPAPLRRLSLSSCQPGACPARPSSWLPKAATSFPS